MEQRIQDAVAAGKTPRRQASGKITLPLANRRHVVLAHAKKGQTEAGAFYKTLVGENQGLHGLGGDQITRPNQGNREYLTGPRGKKTLLRTLNEADGQWAYTAAGRRYFMGNQFGPVIDLIDARIVAEPQNECPF